MIKIQLNKGYVALVDDQDGDLAVFDWRVSMSQKKDTIYVQRTEKVNGKHHTVSLHSVILERKMGRPLEKGRLCDHRDNNGLNNQRYNLRPATPSQNAQNQRGKKSGLKGAYFKGGKRPWISKIYANGESIPLGSYETELEAHQAYCDAAPFYHGEFANFG